MGEGHSSCMSSDCTMSMTVSLTRRVALRSSTSSRRRMIWARSQSPTRTAVALPQRALTEGCPRRVSARSMMSSWRSEALCSISTHTARRRVRRERRASLPRVAAAISRRRGRSILPLRAEMYSSTCRSSVLSPCVMRRRYSRRTCSSSGSKFIVESDEFVGEGF